MPSLKERFQCSAPLAGLNADHGAKASQGAHQIRGRSGRQEERRETGGGEENIFIIWQYHRVDPSLVPCGCCPVAPLPQGGLPVAAVSDADMARWDAWITSMSPSWRIEFTSHLASLDAADRDFTRAALVYCMESPLLNA
jgi:hypothetical protein